MKGQAGAVFLLLVGAVFGIAFMALVYNVWKGMSPSTHSLNIQRIKNALISASRASGIGIPVVLRDMEFREGEGIGADLVRNVTGKRGRFVCGPGFRCTAGGAYAERRVRASVSVCCSGNTCTLYMNKVVDRC